MEEELLFDELPPTASTWSHMTAGAIAGVAEHTAFYPLDTIKTHQQTMGRAALNSSSFQVASQIYQTTGWRGFYRGTLHASCSPSCASPPLFLPSLSGVSAVALGSAPSHAMYFAVYEQMKHSFVGENPQDKPIQVGIAGVVATVRSSCCALARGFL